MSWKWNRESDIPKEAEKAKPYTVPKGWKPPTLKELYLYVMSRPLTFWSRTDTRCLFSGLPTTSLLSVWLCTGARHRCRCLWSESWTEEASRRGMSSNGGMDDVCSCVCLFANESASYYEFCHIVLQYVIHHHCTPSTQKNMYPDPRPAFSAQG